MSGCEGLVESDENRGASDENRGASDENRGPSDENLGTSDENRVDVGDGWYGSASSDTGVGLDFIDAVRGGNAFCCCGGGKGCICCC